MTFLNPILAAVGLGCIAIPIIIHILMRRRRRPVAWGAMKFLLEAYRRQRRRVNLEQILLLATRCLLVALLALALGKPVLGAAGLLGSAGPRTLYLLIDNSLTSSVVTGGVPGGSPALERSKAQALNLLAQLDQGRGDRVAVLTLASPNDGLVLPATPDLAGAGELIRALSPADSRADFSGALARVRDELRRDGSATTSAGNNWLALLSEFRAGAADTSASVPGLSAVGTPDSGLNVLASTPASEPIDNVTIEGVDPLRGVLISPAEGAAGQRAGASAGVRITLRRTGPGVGAGGVTKVRLEALRPAGAPGERAPAAEVVVQWQPGQETAAASASVEVPAAEIGAMASTDDAVIVAQIDRDAVAGDNTLRRPMESRSRLEVALLAPGQVAEGGSINSFTTADWLALALSPETDLAVRRRRNGEVRITVLDPARTLASQGGAGALGEFDALLVPRPDLIDAPGWRQVRVAVDRGALLVVMPPSHEQTHLWTDAMIEALGLDWSIGREPRTLSPAGVLTSQRVLPAGPDLLELLAPELDSLAKPVAFSRILDITAPAGSFEPLLTLSDGTPILVMGQAGTGEAGPINTQPTPAVGPVASRGLVLFFAAPPELSWTDLPAKPLMVPLLQELIRQGIGRSLGTHTTVAGGSPGVVPGAVELVRLAGDDTGAGATDGGLPRTVSIDAGGRLSPAIRNAGLWVFRNDDGSTLGITAFNADPQASSTEVLGIDELTRWLSPVSNEIVWLEDEGAPTLGTPGGGAAAASVLETDSRVPPLSFPLLAAGALLAVLEAVLARLFSHARADAQTGIIAPRSVVLTTPGGAKAA